MIEKPGDLLIKGSGMRDGRSCLLQTALHHPIVEAAEPDNSKNRDDTPWRIALHRHVVEPLTKPEDSENREATHCGTALHRPVVEQEDSEYWDATHCRTALQRPVVEPAAEPEDPGTGDAAPYRQLFTNLL